MTNQSLTPFWKLNLGLVVKVEQMSCAIGIYWWIWCCIPSLLAWKVPWLEGILQRLLMQGWKLTWWFLWQCSCVVKWCSVFAKIKPETSYKVHCCYFPSVSFRSWSGLPVTFLSHKIKGLRRLFLTCFPHSTHSKLLCAPCCAQRSLAGLPHCGSMVLQWQDLFVLEARVNELQLPKSLRQTGSPYSCGFLYYYWQMANVSVAKSLHFPFAVEFIIM